MAEVRPRGQEEEEAGEEAAAAGRRALGILVIITLVAIQALSNLIADWNKDPEEHTPMDEIDETEIANMRATLKED